MAFCWLLIVINMKKWPNSSSSQKEEMKWNSIWDSKQKKLRYVKPSNGTEHWKVIYLFIDSLSFIDTLYWTLNTEREKFWMCINSMEAFFRKSVSIGHIGSLWNRNQWWEKGDNIPLFTCYIQPFILSKFGKLILFYSSLPELIQALSGWNMKKTNEKNKELKDDE